MCAETNVSLTSKIERGFLDSTILSIADIPDSSVIVIGIPGATCYPNSIAHSINAPNSIREESFKLSANKNHYDFDLNSELLPKDQLLFDCGNIIFDADNFPGNRSRIETAYNILLSKKSRPLLLGGDDSVQIPALKAFSARGDITVLQIDAHIDWREEAHGERFGLSSTMRRASELSGVKSIVQVGARGVGSARTTDVQDALAQATIIDMRQIRSKGIGNAVDKIPEGRDIVVCLDVDGLDPSIIPGVIARSPGGLDYGNITELLNGAASKARIIGFNIVEYVPEKDFDGIGRRTVCRLAMLGAGLMAQSM